ncbi:MAG: nuclear transport factor 2 family protein [Acidobacteria bacterium]|nr:nuclear transport factor 2 family protein [Acidobacteriota bacterium]
MKRLLIIFSLLALPAFSADPAQAVEEAERGWAKGVTTNDFALLGKVLGDDLSYTHSTGALDTKASYIDNLKTGKARYLKVDHEDLKVRLLSKDTAIAICRAAVVTIQNGKENPARLTFLHVFVNRHGQWQMVAHQSARLP